VSWFASNEYRKCDQWALHCSAITSLARSVVQWGLLARPVRPVRPACAPCFGDQWVRLVRPAGPEGHCSVQRVHHERPVRFVLQPLLVPLDRLAGPGTSNSGHGQCGLVPNRLVASGMRSGETAPPRQNCRTCHCIWWVPFAVIFLRAVGSVLFVNKSIAVAARVAKWISNGASILPQGEVTARARGFACHVNINEARCDAYPRHGLV